MGPVSVFNKNLRICVQVQIDAKFLKITKNDRMFLIIFIAVQKQG